MPFVFASIRQRAMVMLQILELQIKLKNKNPSDQSIFYNNNMDGNIMSNAITGKYTKDNVDELAQF